MAPPRPIRKRPPKLSSGDPIEFSISQEVPGDQRGTSTWIKAGATTTIRPGETADAAAERLADFVMAMLEHRISELLAE